MCEKCEDLTGRRFGSLTVIGRSGNDKRGNSTWRCKCDCGKEKNILGYSLKSGSATSCGCKRRIKDLTGKRFGRWTVLGMDYSNGNTKCLCKCDCGKEKIVNASSLLFGSSTCCGCKRNIKDLTGQQFGDWIVEERAGNDKNKSILWRCRCTLCGKERDISTNALTKRNGYVCDCKKIGIGQQFGDWIVEERAGSNKSGSALWRCRCRLCGKEKEISTRVLMAHNGYACSCKKDLVGKRFGDWIVEERAEIDKRGSILWRCRCTLCGKEKDIPTYELTTRSSYVCDCKKDLVGQQFGDWIVEERAGNDKWKSVLWRCRCTLCGKFKNISATILTRHNGYICDCKKDLVGQQFGDWIVKEKVGSDKRGNTLWRCKCTLCGRKRDISTHDLNIRNGYVCDCKPRKKSSGEEDIKLYLDRQKIVYTREFVLSNLRTSKNGHPKMDFKIPLKNGRFVFLEYHGKQHYAEIKNWPEFGKVEREETDPMKMEYCKKNNIPLYIIPYFKKTIVELEKILQKIEPLRTA